MGVPVEEIASIPLFAGLDRGTQGRLAGWFDERTYRAGDHIVREGQSGYAFCVLARGAATVSRAGQVIAELRAGDFFGEMSIIGEGRRTATVVADSDVAVWSMFGADFRLLQREMPDVAAVVAQAVAERAGT